MKTAPCADCCSFRIPHSAFRICNSGFVLLEVLISLTILGFTAATILRSFTQSLEAARRAQTINTATLLAEDLIEEVQVDPPGLGLHEGDFGPDHPGYTYTLEVKDEDIDYRSVSRAREVEDLRPLRRLTLEVFYRDARHSTLRMIHVDSAFIGLQKFSDAALREYQLFELY
ncbi:MAG: type II secretion system protein [Candidatus Sumerlaeota bacterium]|nr:type II secretion system protein [Candidatus Sumerlaeota bacterium]